MEFVKKSMSKWIEAVLVLVVGILVIVAGAQMGDTSTDALVNGNGASDTIKSISLVLGWSFIVIGSLGVLGGLFAAIFSRAGFASATISASLVLSVGIWLAAKQQAGNLMFVLIGFVPFVMIVFGAVLVFDAFFAGYRAIKGKEIKKALPPLIFGLVVAIASIVLGALCIATGENGDTIIASNAQLIIFGIILVIYSAFLVLATFVSIPLVAVVTVKDEGKDENKENIA